MGLGFSFTGHSLGAQKMDKLGVNPENAAHMEETFRFSKRLHAERLSMERASTLVTSTGQERFEQYSHPLYAGAVDVTDDARFAVIPPGVNTRVFSTEKKARDEEVRDRLLGRVATSGAATSLQPCIIVSSRLDGKKNIAGVVDAYVSNKSLQDRACLLIVIRGVEDPYTDISTLPESEREVLRPILETIEGAQLRNSIDFLDIRSQQDLASAYRVLARRRSVFALTSFYEPFGLAPIEAAACGLAVVATQNGGPSEIFVDEAGVLVDPTDIEDIARGLLEALEHYERYAERGRGRVAERYTWNATAAGYFEVIERRAAQTHVAGLAQRDAGAGDGQVGIGIHVCGKQLAVIHLVNMIPGQYQNVLGMMGFDDVQALIYGVGGSLEPGFFRHPLLRRNDVHELAHLIVEPAPAVNDMTDERMGFVLGQNGDFLDA